MSIRVAYEEVKKNVKQAFLNLGLTEEQAETCATIHTQSSADGVESHGLNRIPRFVEYVQKGWINLEGKPQLVGAKGAVENYDGQLGIGIQMLFSVQSGLQSWRKSMELAVLL